MMERKIRGVEQELAMNTQPALPHRSLVHLVGMAIEGLKVRGLVTNVRVEDERLDFMALNGFRVYNDMSHLELSTPSYNTPLEAVVYDKVAELFSYYAVSHLGEYFKTVNAYKNNVSNTAGDSGEWRTVSYSTHSSILMDRSVCNLDVWDRLEKALIPFMVARVPLIGGGDLVSALRGGGYKRTGKELRGDTLRFAISPRAFFTRRLSSNDTVDARGLLNQRDDPHADPGKYWRLHDINWEGLRSPYQIYLRDCLEVLVTSAYEGGYVRDPPELADPVTSVKEVSGDSEACNWKVQLKDGRRVDAIADILEGCYLSAIEEMLDESAPTPGDRMAFNLVKATLQGLGERRLEHFIDGLDWVTKKALIDEYAPGDVEGALGICNQYALIDGSVLKYIGESVDPEVVQTTFDYDAGLEFARDAIPLVDWDGFGGRVRYALRNGPEGTREYLRCLVAREFPFLVESIEWERVTFPSGAIRLDEPFSFNKAMCGDRLEKATENFAAFREAVQRIDREGSPMIYAPVDDHEKLDDDEQGGVGH